MTKEEFEGLIPGDKIIYDDTSCSGGMVFIVKGPFSASGASIICLHNNEKYSLCVSEHLRRLINISDRDNKWPEKNS